MNAERLARLFRERAQLDLEIADALLETDEKPQRKRPRSPLAKTVKPSSAALESVRASLENQGIQSR